MGEEDDADSLLSIARSELDRLSAGLNVLLNNHQPDESGRCPTCAGTARSNPWPCKVWQIAHRQLIAHQAQEQREATTFDAAKTERIAKHLIEVSDVSVIPEPIVASTGPGPSDWDTGEFTRPNLTTATRQRSKRLETDHTKIYRAAVVNRS